MQKIKGIPDDTDTFAEIEERAKLTLSGKSRSYVTDAGYFAHLALKQGEIISALLQIVELQPDDGTNPFVNAARKMRGA